MRTAGEDMEYWVTRTKGTLEDNACTTLVLEAMYC